MNGDGRFELWAQPYATCVVKQNQKVVGGVVRVGHPGTAEAQAGCAKGESKGQRLKRKISF